MKVFGLWVAVITLVFLNVIHSEPLNEPASNRPARAIHKVVVKRTPVSRAPAPRGPTPAAEGPSPATEGPNPATEGPSPATEGPSPATEGPNPAVDGPKSAAERPKPATDEPKLTAEEPKPVAEGPKPAAEEPVPAGQSPRLSRSAGYPRWQKSDSDYASEASQPSLTSRLPAWLQGIFKIPAEPLSDSDYKNVQRPDWAKGTVRLNVPVGGDSTGQLSPVLLLPIPVPVKDNSKCDANQNNLDRFYPQQESQLPYEPNDFPSRGGGRQPRPPPPPPAAYDDGYDEPAPAPLPKPSRPSRPQAPSRPDKFSIDEVYAIPPASQPPKRPNTFSISEVYTIPPAPQPTPKPNTYSVDEVYAIPPGPQLAPQQGTYFESEVNNIRPTQERTPQRPPQPPFSEGKVPSRVLVELFRAQKPTAPHLPPVVTREWRPETEAVPRPVPLPLPGVSGKVPNEILELTAPYPERGNARAKSSPGSAYIPPSAKDSFKEPPLPRFDRPLVVRGEVTVPRADYTEAYTARWDAASGAATMVLHQGTASTHRMVSSEGQVKRVLRRVDRSGEQPMHRCTVMPQSTLTPADKIPPFLPDTKDFSFKGHVEYGDVKAELWKHTVLGGPGELGGARGEALTFRHELLVARAPADAPMPLMYSVAVDSSVLGPDCDGHVHRFFEAREEQHDQGHFQFDMAKSCDATEQTNDMSKVEPLREFTMLQRDPRYDDMFKEFMVKYDRKYADSDEEAVRKNLLTQTNRFVSSGNRVGATFSLQENYLADWLREERRQLLGALPGGGSFPADQFPYSRPTLAALGRKMPTQFDWRERGAVTPVRFQDACASCWAFAVVGAVEGALFRRTRRLVPLSEKCLVDCAKPYGGNGCKGTQPSRAYDYIREQGLPARDLYTPYKPKVEQCVAQRVPPVTRISGYVNVTQLSVAALKVAIRRHVPTVVLIDGQFESFANYKAGVYEDNRCSRESRNHAVLAVGYGGSAEEPHFILKNSWGATWGDGGYVSVYGPTNTCGVLNQPSYPRLLDEDVARAPAADARAARRADQDYD